MINYGSGGLGTTPHMAGELFSLQAGVKMVHVAYRGEAPAIADVVAGQLPLQVCAMAAPCVKIREAKRVSRRGIAILGF